MKLDNLGLRHLFGLVIAISEIFSGFWPHFNADRALLAFGLPEPTAQSVPAQTAIFMESSRISIMGMIIFALYG